MLVLHTNKHKCPHLVPSVGCPFASAVALIRFHSFLPSSYCWMYLWKSEMGMKDNLCRVFSCGRQTADLSLTSYSSPARLLSASSFAAWTWQIRDLSVTASSGSCAFFFCLKENEKKNVFGCLPAIRTISAHLCFFFPPLSLCSSNSLKSSIPESLENPSSPWNLEWKPTRLTCLFAPCLSRIRTHLPYQRKLFLELDAQITSMTYSYNLKACWAILLVVHAVKNTFDLF